MDSSLVQFIIVYKYILLVPAAFVEGHIITLIAGFLARLGYLNPFLAGVSVAFGNLLGDVALYWLGYHKGHAVARSWGKYFGITEASIEKTTKVFHSHTNRILLISKLTNGFGLAMAVLFTAGLTRIPFRVFMVWNVIGECLWTGILISLGFFLGQLYIVVDTVIWRIGVVGVSLTLIFLSIRFFSYMTKQRVL
jgi:membrane protein DedA with SNARE-associated domain